MKQLTSYNRVAGYLNKIFDLLNEKFFENALSRPTITIQSTPKAYGHFSTRSDTWISANGEMHEINIGAGTLARPIENVVATLLHEMVHYYNYMIGVQDCSRGGTYHNQRFKQAAEARGLQIDHHPTYGWVLTSPGDALLDFVLENDLTDILITRNDQYGITANSAGNCPGKSTETPSRRSSSRKYVCPCCGISVRATKVVRISCTDCAEEMVEC